MSNLYFPICALFISTLLLIVFRSKKRIKSVETQTYSGLLLANFFDALFGVIIIYLAYKYQNTILIKIFNRLDFPTYLLWAWLFFIYIFYISTKNKKIGQYYTKMIKITGIINVVLLIFILLLPFNIINENNIMYANGPAVNVLYMSCGLYIVGIVICLIINAKSIINKKYAPIYALVLLAIFVAIIRIYNPQLLLISAVISYIDLIMYFTIENPDVKMIQELEVARSQAEKANHAKTDFLSSMSHEIRTPLNAIVGFSDYIMTSESLDEAKENAQDIINASQTLLEIVNGILDISKIEAGKLEIVNSKYNAPSTFEGLAKLITPKMEEKGLDFSYYIAPDIPETLFGDHANIKKVITNLLSNAYKYTDQGFVRYEVNCINSSDSTKLIITVEDSGRGIKKESIDKLFTKFQRLDEDRNTTIEGTGLGLAITKQLIELMNGKIIVHTVYGEGSKFTIVLNQKIEATPINESTTPVSATLDLKDKKILLVDDNSLNIKVANKILERYHANNITSVDSGFACLEKIATGEVYDVILLDDMMPKMSGPETLKRLKENPTFHQPVVALTANAITGMKEKYLADGFDDYLAKPIEKDELIRVLNSIFAKTKTNSPTISTSPIQESSKEEKEPTEQLEIIDEEEIENTDSNSAEAFLTSNGVDLAKALELLGDIEMYNMTVGDFLAEVEDKWNNIVSYKNANDMANYAIEVHSLKSDSKYLGLMKLAEVAYEHELKSKENNTTFINENFDRLEKVYRESLEIIKKYQAML